ncbi:Rna methyltransferase, partial [Globisporangium splendens]
MLPPRLLPARASRLPAGAACRCVRWWSASRETPCHKRQLPLLITGVNDQGDGAGVLTDGSDVPVYVPFALPGEQLVVELWERDLQASRKWKASEKEPKWPVFGQKVATVTPSEHRTLPRCEKFFGNCGGCKLQHLRYDQQLQQKQMRIEALLEKAPQHSPNMHVRPIIGAKADAAVSDYEEDGIYAYRNKMEFTCSTGRWLLDSDKPQEDENSIDGEPEAPQHYPFTIGLFPVASTSVRRARQISGKRRRGKTNASWSPRILSIDECSLQDPVSNRILQRVSTLCEDEGLEAYNFQTHRGFLKQVVLRKGTKLEQQTEVMVGFVTSSFAQDQSEALARVVDQLMHEFGRNSSSIKSQDAAIVSVLQRLDDQALRHQGQGGSVEEKERVLFGQSYFEDSILGHRFRVSFDSFFQPNTAQASRLYREIQHTLAASSQALSESGEQRKPIVWDLFCGVGSIGICMGEFAAKVYGFEIVEAAVEKARANAELNGYTSAEMQFFTMDLTKRWDDDEWGNGSAIEKPDIVIVDPPRAGLHSKLIKFLRQLGPPQICYVSCNPGSQVHDLELLCASLEAGSSTATASYEVEYLQPVDMLPHTPHIETIAWLRRLAHFQQNTCPIAELKRFHIMPRNSVAVTNDDTCAPCSQVPRETSQPDVTGATSRALPSLQVRPHKLNARRLTRCKSAPATEKQGCDDAPDPLGRKDLQLAATGPAGIVSSEFQRPVIARVKTDTDFASLDREILVMLQLKLSNCRPPSNAPSVRRVAGRRSIAEAQDSFREHYRRRTNSSHSAYLPQESLRGAQQSKRSVPVSMRHGASSRWQSCSIL